METYNPILETRALERRTFGSPRSRPGPGIAHVLYGRRRESLVLTEGDRLTLGESYLGRYTQSFVVDLSVKRLERTSELPCRSDTHNFAAAFALTCQVVDPRVVVEHNIRDAGVVLWSAVVGHARAVSRAYGPAEIAEAEHAIAERLASVVLHPAFVCELVEVRLSHDPQAVRIGRRGTEIQFWNSLVDNRFAAAHMAEHPGDIHGALEILRQMRQQYEESVAAYEQLHSRVGSEFGPPRNESLEQQARQLGLSREEVRKDILERESRRFGFPSHTEVSSEGARPTVAPQEVSGRGDGADEEPRRRRSPMN